MRTVSASATLPASPATVFAFVAEPANLPRWLTGVVEVGRTGDGPVEVGTTARVVRELMGQRIAADLTVTEYETDRRLAMATTVSGINAAIVAELEPVDAGTAVTVTMTIRAENAFLVPLEGMAAGAAEQDLADSLRRLEAALAAG